MAPVTPPQPRGLRRDPPSGDNAALLISGSLQAGMGSPMANRQLTAEELVRTRALLDDVRSRLAELSAGDKELLFAFRRKVYKELSYDERSKPMTRRALKDKKWKEQRGLCAICNKDLPATYTVLDRLNAADGYTAENTRLIHQDCDVSHQKSKGYA